MTDRDELEAALTDDMLHHIWMRALKTETDATYLRAWREGIVDVLFPQKAAEVQSHGRKELGDPD